MKDNLKKFKDLLLGSRDLTTLGVANIVGTGINGIFWFVMASLLGSALYGEVSYFYAIASIGAAIGLLGAKNTLIVYVAKQVKIQGTVGFVSLVASLLISAVVFFIFYNLGVSLFVVGFVVFALVIFEMLGKKEFGIYSRYFVAQRILLVIFSISLYYLLGVDGIILGIALSYFPFSIKLIKTFRKSKIDFPILKPRFRFMMNSFGLDISSILTLNIDKLVIFPIFGYALLGNYQLGAQFLILLNILPLTVFQYALSHDASGDSKDKLKKFTIFASIGLAMVGFIFSPIVIPALFPEYDRAVVIFQVMGFAIIPITINQMYISKFLGIEKSNIVVISSGIFLAVQIVLILFLGQIYEIVGVAFATVIAASCQSLYLLLMNRQLQKETDKKP